MPYTLTSCGNALPVVIHRNYYPPKDIHRIAEYLPFTGMYFYSSRDNGFFKQFSKHKIYYTVAA